MNLGLFIPKSSIQITEETVWPWYMNVPKEISIGFLSGTEIEHMQAYYSETGLLRAWRKPFFRYHYAHTFAIAAKALLGVCARPRIVDLGCGFGTQSLFLSAMGAEVIALDMDVLALSILAKRKTYYENALGRRLDIQIHNVNTLEFDFEDIAPIHGVWSMFAFNMMKPHSALLDHIVRGLSSDAVFTILDGNMLSWTARFLPGRKREVWSPLQFEDELRKKNFGIVAHLGGVSFPPILFKILPYKMARQFDRVMSNNWLFPISHLLVAKKM
jgi:SAM-dependent methyltransferase